MHIDNEPGSDAEDDAMLEFPGPGFELEEEEEEEHVSDAELTDSTTEPLDGDTLRDA